MPTLSPLDPRAARTRRVLVDALIELVVEYGYATLTVRQIAARAGVARTTFYAHFQGKDDLLFNGLRARYEALRAAVAPGEMNATADWDHVAAHADFYRVMLGPQGSAAFVAHLRTLLADAMRDHLLAPLTAAGTPRLDVDFMAHYLAGAQLGLYQWWLDSGMRAPAAEMAQAGQDLAVKGLLWGAGLAGSAVEAPA